MVTTDQSWKWGGAGRDFLKRRYPYPLGSNLVAPGRHDILRALERAVPVEILAGRVSIDIFCETIEKCDTLHPKIAPQRFANGVSNRGGYIDDLDNKISKCAGSAAYRQIKLMGCFFSWGQYN